MKYLVYVSTATKLMSDAELFEILVTSRARKNALNLTGMLLYHDGLLIQVLEGKIAAVDTFFNEVEHDPRNKNVIKLTEGQLTKRNFSNWSMSFIPANIAAFEEVEGYTHPSDANFLNTENTHPAIIILKTFVDNNAMRNK